MALRIELKKWYIIDKGNFKTVAGVYKVMNGANTIAESNFNDGYDHIVIPIPISIISKVEELSEEIKNYIINYFNN